MPRQQRVAPGGIDQETRQPFGFASLLFDRRDARPLAFIQRDIGDTHLLAHLGAEPPAVVEQQLVELRAPDLVAVADAQIRIVGKAERAGRFMRIGDEFRARFIHADVADLIGNAEPLEHGRLSGSSNSPIWKRGKRSFSRTTTCLCCCARGDAIVDPAGPPPTTSTSHSEKLFMMATHFPELELRCRSF